MFKIISVVIGFLLRVSQDLHLYLTSYEEMYDYISELSILLINEDHLDFVDLYTTILVTASHPFLFFFFLLFLYMLLLLDMGNLFLFFVVDFIRFAFWNRFPTFNVADIAITVGVALLVIYILFIDGKKENKSGTP